MTSDNCAGVKPLSIPRFMWKVSCSAWPAAIRAAIVARLRSRGERPGLAQTSANSTSSV